VAELAGVTVRTLHHYDGIGLVPPSARTAAGYRAYSAGHVERLGASACSCPERSGSCLSAGGVRDGLLRDARMPRHPADLGVRGDA
jgi:hypothetical protein